MPEGGVTGHELIASPDGKTAYVPIYGDSGVGQPGSDGRNLAVIDLVSRKVVGNVDFGHGVRPHCPLVGPDGLLYVTTEIDNSVTVIDPRTLKIVGPCPPASRSPTCWPSRAMAARLHRQRRPRHGLGLSICRRAGSWR